MCHAENVNGVAESSATVIVRRKTIIEVAPMDLEVRTGVNAKFTCSGTTDPQVGATVKETQRDRKRGSEKER